MALSHVSIRLLLKFPWFAFNLLAEAEAAARSGGAGPGPGSTGGSSVKNGAICLQQGPSVHGCMLDEMCVSMGQAVHG